MLKLILLGLGVVQYLWIEKQRLLTILVSFSLSDKPSKIWKISICKSQAIKFKFSKIRISARSEQNAMKFGMVNAYIPLKEYIKFPSDSYITFYSVGSPKWHFWKSVKYDPRSQVDISGSTPGTELRLVTHQKEVSVINISEFWQCYMSCFCFRVITNHDFF